MAESLQRRLEKALSGVGYTEKVGQLPPEVVRSERLTGFLEWLLQVLQPANHLSTTELEKFEELKSSGKVLEGSDLHKVLSSHTEEENPEHIRREVADLKIAVAPLKTQLRTLNTIRQSLSDHYSVLAHERDDLERQRRECQHHYQRAMETAKEDNTKVNKALEELQSAVQEVSAFHRGEGGGLEATPSFLSAVSQEPYHSAEDQFLTELTAYTKKQFFQGIAVMAHSTNGAEYGAVDLTNAESILLRGVSEEQYQKHHQELVRLQSLYPLTEVQRINDLVTEQHVLGACRRAEEELELLTQQRGVRLDHNALRHQVKEKQAKVAELRSQIHSFGQVQLPVLLEDMAALEVTKILHGDYDLKIARQDYFTSKQDKVIGHLQSQRARHELLSMLYEVELRRHRETHRLLTTTGSHLTQLKEEREKRIQAMQSASVLPVKAVRQTIDSRDMFAQRLSSLLGVQPTTTAPLITHASLVEAVEQLSHQLAAMEALMATSDTEMQQQTSGIESLTAKFEKELFGHAGSTDEVQLTPKEFEEECLKLQSVVGTLEGNIKSLLKDYDSKKKVLQASPLMDTERRLYSYFFTNPAKLTQVVAELARRVDSIAETQKA